MKGIFYGVSTGPGDPELMTVKAIRIIERCKVIAAPRTSGGRMLAYSIAAQAADMTGKLVLPLDMPMTGDSGRLHSAWDAAADSIEAHLAAGEDAAMLTIGDVSLYSTYSYIADRIAQRGYECRMCAGVPSFCACAAAHGIPLVQGDEVLTVIPAYNEDIAEYLDRAGTKVIMKGAHAAVTDGEIYAVENCGLDGERLTRSIPPESGYFTTVIVK